MRPVHSGTLARAVLTGVAYGYRHALDELSETPLDKITVTGGGARSTIWMQIFADVLGIPVHIVSDAENIGVRGAVVAATGKAVVVPIAATYTPDGEHRAFHDAQYTVFREAYPALKSVFEGLANLPA